MSLRFKFVTFVLILTPGIGIVVTQFLFGLYRVILVNLHPWSSLGNHRMLPNTAHQQNGHMTNF